MPRADLALAAFGVTAYELAAFGVPALYLVHHAKTMRSRPPPSSMPAWAFRWGLPRRADDKAIAGAVWALLSDAERRREMRSAGLMTIDGNGGRAHRRRSGRCAGGEARRHSDANCELSLAGVWANASAQSPRVARHHAQRRRRERLVSAARSSSNSCRRGFCRSATPDRRCQPGDRRRRAHHRIERREHRGGAVEFVFLVDAGRHDDIAPAHRFQRRDFVRLSRRIARRRRVPGSSRRNAAQASSGAYCTARLPPVLPLRQHTPIKRARQMREELRASVPLPPHRDGDKRCDVGKSRCSLRRKRGSVPISMAALAPPPL